MIKAGICQGVCKAPTERALFASGAFEVCIHCLKSAAWLTEKRRREADGDEPPTRLHHVPMVKG